MPQITEPATYLVRITDWYVKELKFENDPTAFAIILRGVTSDGLEGFGEMVYSHMEYEGKTSAQRVTETLKSMGVQDGNPGNLDTAIQAGLEAKFVAKRKEGERGSYLQINVYPLPKMVKGSEVDMNQVIARFNAVTQQQAAPPPPFPPQQQQQAQQPQPTLPATGTDDIPF